MDSLKNDLDNVDVEASEKTPNIIFVQLESFFDPTHVKGITLSENPLPNYQKLISECSSGYLSVPCFGAGTCNTEFEVQTGMSTQFFGAGEYPFKTVMTSVSCDSMGYDLKRIGYATAGVHNNDATFYERYIDYSNLGFDSFTAQEHMYNLNHTPRGWAKDDVLDDVMIERMKQTEGRDYITTITVQGHGRYPKNYTHTLTDLTCEFGGKYADDEEKRIAWTYYINMIHETDNMLRSLIYKLNQSDEPTVVFMYGDHLPSLNLEASDLQDITLYQTEWAMWDNFGLEKDSYILFLGRLVPEKGIRYLVEAFKNVKTDKKLVIAGGSSDTDSFMEELKELAKGDDRILFTGFVQGAMLEELYSNTYIYTLPSDLEGMPLSLLEAMSYGNCCLVSDIPECAEVVEDKALIFKKSDVKDLQEKLQDACDHPEMVMKMKKQAADFICEKYNWDDVVKETMKLYRRK